MQIMRVSSRIFCILSINSMIVTKIPELKKTKNNHNPMLTKNTEITSLKASTKRREQHFNGTVE
jgi:hypothetical protein